MRGLFSLIMAVVPAILIAPTVYAKGSRPNLIIILADDMGYGDVSCQGAPLIRTPNIDRMAGQGMRFTDFYVHPVCGVTRAALMTGSYAMRVAEVGNRKHGHPFLHPEEVTIAEVLKDAGYATALVGKWHLAGGGGRERGPGTGPYPAELMPNAQGFDYFFGTPAHNGVTRELDLERWKTVLMRDDEVIAEPVDMDTLTKRYAEEAVRWIHEHKDRPFFLYLAHNMPHVVLGASERFRGASDGGLYGDVVEEVDWSVGRVLEAVREAGMDEKTLVVFTSDNGPWIEDHLKGEGGTDAHYGSAGPLRGAKMMTWEGGVRVPFVARWPGRIPAGATTDQPATIMDLLPTFAALAGGETPGDRVIDGRDIRPLLFGEADARSPHEAIYYYSFVHLQAVRSGRWKLVLPRPAGPRWTSWSARMIDAVGEIELYDLERDPGETRNVAGRHPLVVERLLVLIEKGRGEIGDYNRVGRGARFFEDGERRPESRQWLGER